MSTAVPTKVDTDKQDNVPQTFPTTCKCPFEHHPVAPPSGPVPLTGSRNFPDVHAFDALNPPFTLSTTQERAVADLKTFLQFPTITADVPQGAGQQCVKWFGQLADYWGLSHRVLEFTPGYPLFLISVPGYDDATLPSVLLNSHYDVVPVYPEQWTHPPFAATELDNGDIVARGVQDMKSVCIQHFYGLVNHLIARADAQGIAYTIPGLQQPNTTVDNTTTPPPPPLGQLKLLRRTIHLAIVPDEEVAGIRGTQKWVKSPEFDALDIEFALDEGLASPNSEIIAFYGERAVWWVRIKATGPTGHGSRFVQDTAVERLMCAVNQLLCLRDEEYTRLHGPHSTGDDVGCAHAKAATLGDVATINLTMLQAGVRGTDEYIYNVIPQEAHAGFDIRIPPHIPLEEFRSKIQAMLPDGVEMTWVVDATVNPVSPHDESDVYWNAVQQACHARGLVLSPQVFPAATDARWLRQSDRRTKTLPDGRIVPTGVQAIGFSPIFNQPVLMHDHDERLNKFVFAQGLDLMQDVIANLGDLGPSANTTQ